MNGRRKSINSSNNGEKLKQKPKSSDRIRAKMSGSDKSSVGYVDLNIKSLFNKANEKKDNITKDDNNFDNSNEEKKADPFIKSKSAENPSLKNLLHFNIISENKQTHEVFYKEAMMNRSLLDNVNGIVIFNEKTIDKILKLIKQLNSFIAPFLKDEILKAFPYLDYAIKLHILDLKASLNQENKSKSQSNAYEAMDYNLLSNNNLLGINFEVMFIKFILLMNERLFFLPHCFFDKNLLKEAINNKNNDCKVNINESKKKTKEDPVDVEVQVEKPVYKNAFEKLLMSRQNTKPVIQKSESFTAKSQINISKSKLNKIEKVDKNDNKVSKNKINSQQNNKKSLKEYLDDEEKNKTNENEQPKYKFDNIQGSLLKLTENYSYYKNKSGILNNINRNTTLNYQDLNSLECSNYYLAVNIKNYIKNFKNTKYSNNIKALIVYSVYQEEDVLSVSKIVESVCNELNYNIIKYDELEKEKSAQLQKISEATQSHRITSVNDSISEKLQILEKAILEEDMALSIFRPSKENCDLTKDTSDEEYNSSVEVDENKLILGVNKKNLKSVKEQTFNQNYKNKNGNLNGNAKFNSNNSSSVPIDLDNSIINDDSSSNKSYKNNKKKRNKTESKSSSTQNLNINNTVNNMNLNITINSKANSNVPSIINININGLNTTSRNKSVKSLSRNKKTSNTINKNINITVNETDNMEESSNTSDLYSKVTESDKFKALTQAIYQRVSKKKTLILLIDNKHTNLENKNHLQSLTNKISNSKCPIILITNNLDFVDSNIMKDREDKKDEIKKVDSSQFFTQQNATISNKSLLTYYKVIKTHVSINSMFISKMRLLSKIFYINFLHFFFEEIMISSEDNHSRDPYSNNLNDFGKFYSEILFNYNKGCYPEIKNKEENTFFKRLYKRLKFFLKNIFLGFNEYQLRKEPTHRIRTFVRKIFESVVVLVNSCNYDEERINNSLYRIFGNLRKVTFFIKENTELINSNFCLDESNEHENPYNKNVNIKCSQINGLTDYKEIKTINLPFSEIKETKEEYYSSTFRKEMNIDNCNKNLKNKSISKFIKDDDSIDMNDQFNEVAFEDIETQTLNTKKSRSRSLSIDQIFRDSRPRDLNNNYLIKTGKNVEFMNLNLIPDEEIEYGQTKDNIFNNLIQCDRKYYTDQSPASSVFNRKLNINTKIQSNCGLKKDKNEYSFNELLPNDVEDFYIHKLNHYQINIKNESFSGGLFLSNNCNVVNKNQLISKTNSGEKHENISDKKENSNSKKYDKTLPISNKETEENLDIKNLLSYINESEYLSNLDELITNYNKKKADEDILIHEKLIEYKSFKNKKNETYRIKEIINAICPNLNTALANKNYNQLSMDSDSEIKTNQYEAETITDNSSVKNGKKPNSRSNSKKKEREESVNKVKSRTVKDLVLEEALEIETLNADKKLRNIDLKQILDSENYFSYNLKLKLYTKEDFDFFISFDFDSWYNYILNVFLEIFPVFKFSSITPTKTNLHFVYDSFCIIFSLDMLKFTVLFKGENQMKTRSNVKEMTSYMFKKQLADYDQNFSNYLSYSQMNINNIGNINNYNSLNKSSTQYLGRPRYSKNSIEQQNLSQGNERIYFNSNSFGDVTFSRNSQQVQNDCNSPCTEIEIPSSDKGIKIQNAVDILANEYKLRNRNKHKGKFSHTNKSKKNKFSSSKEFDEELLNFEKYRKEIASKIQIFIEFYKKQNKIEAFDILKRGVYNPKIRAEDDFLRSDVNTIILSKLVYELLRLCQFSAFKLKLSDNNVIVNRLFLLNFKGNRIYENLCKFFIILAILHSNIKKNIQSKKRDHLIEEEDDDDDSVKSDNSQDIYL